MKYKNYFFLIILLFISSVNFNLLIKPLHIICGGTQGLSIIINKLTNIDTSLVILLINIFMFILSIIFLNKKISLGIIISTFFYPFFIKLTSNISININNILINIFLIGIISGICNGLIYKLGFSSSGINILGPLINKYLDIKIGTINLIINIIIILFNILLFNINNLIYSILIIIINSLLINIILYKNNYII